MSAYFYALKRQIGGFMRNFIKRSLANALLVGVKGGNEFHYRFKREDGDIISIDGTVEKKEKQYLSDFRIERTKANGHKCSAVPVFGMPLNQRTIADIADVAVESL